MIDRGVGDPALQIALTQRHERPPEDRHDSERREQQRPFRKGFGRHLHGDADQAVAAHFQKHACKDRRGRPGGVDMGGRKPCVDRNERRLDREPGKESEEHQSCAETAAGEGRLRDDRAHVEGQRRHGQGQHDDADQDQKRPHKGVEKEFQGGALRVAMAPTPDEKVHPDERKIEEDIEPDQVQRQEQAERNAGEKQDPGVIRAGPREAGHGPGRGGEEDERAHQGQAQRDAVHAHSPGDAQPGRPYGFLHELKSGAGRVPGPHDH